MAVWLWENERMQSLAQSLFQSVFPATFGRLFPRFLRRSAVAVACLLLAACGTAPKAPEQRPLSPEAQEVVLFSLGLLNTGYRFGGKNPEAGLDCSGMVSYVYSQAAGLKVKGSAADIAKQGKAVPIEAARPGDLLFFNTQNKPHSHVAIYLGDGRFVHAPSSRGKVRVDTLGTRYYADRLEEARSYFE
jgi:cell wall-associated NlpC family hydrolase